MSRFSSVGASCDATHYNTYQYSGTYRSDDDEILPLETQDYVAVNRLLLNLDELFLLSV